LMVLPGRREVVEEPLPTLARAMRTEGTGVRILPLARETSTPRN
jgi:hypothetical protein